MDSCFIYVRLLPTILAKATCVVCVTGTQSRVAQTTFSELSEIHVYKILRVSHACPAKPWDRNKRMFSCPLSRTKSIITILFTTITVASATTPALCTRSCLHLVTYLIIETKVYHVTLNTISLGTTTVSALRSNSTLCSRFRSFSRSGCTVVGGDEEPTPTRCTPLRRRG